MGPVTALRKLALLAAVVGCSSSLRLVPRSPPPDTLEREFTDFPPPPARIEVIPPDPGGDCAWMDGHWDWKGRRWSWSSGAWVVPPPGCHLTLALLTWGSDRSGQPELAYAPPRWFPDKPAAAGDKPQQCPAPIECPGGRAASDLPAAGAR